MRWLVSKTVRETSGKETTRLRSLISLRFTTRFFKRHHHILKYLVLEKALFECLRPVRLPSEFEVYIVTNKPNVDLGLSGHIMAFLVTDQLLTQEICLQRKLTLSAYLLRAKDVDPDFFPLDDVSESKLR